MYNKISVLVFFGLILLSATVSAATTITDTYVNSSTLNGTYVYQNGSLVLTSDGLNTFSELQSQIVDATLIKAGTLTDTKICIYDSTNGLINCTSDAGAGDITGINTAGTYLEGGCASGTCSLTVNETDLNATISDLDTDTDTTYSHLSNFSDYIGVSADWDAIGDVPTNTPTSGDTANLSTSGQIYSWVIGLNYKTLTEIVASIGNWTADKASYYLKTEIDTQGEMEISCLCPKIVFI